MPGTGDTLAHYRILEPIGQGGMGEVFLAHDTRLDRKVALKFLPEQTAGDATARKRLLREAKSAAALDHPFICKVYETGEVDGEAFIAMEYVAGRSLDERLMRGPMTMVEALRLALEVAEALEEAHARGIVHRDLKPSNIHITPQGHAKVMDFGLAKRFVTDSDVTELDAPTAITEAGKIAGTLAYMSPEQARGEPVDARSDIFSFGIVLYQMLAHENPFQRNSAADILSAILRDTPPSVDSKSSERVHPAVHKILARALTKEPDRRYQNAGELAAELREVLETLYPGRQARWPTALAAGATAAVLAVAGWWLIGGGTTPQPAETPPPLSVLMTNFDNRTTDPVFDGTIEQALGIGLEGASYVALYRRSDARSVAERLGVGSDGRLDRDAARLVARSEGINLVVDGSIEQDGTIYVLRAEAFDAATSEEVAAALRRVSAKAEVLGAVDELAAELRSEIGGAPVESTRVFSAETFTARSLQAMHAYARAQELDQAGREEEAVAAYEEAINDDPDFGRAYAGLAAFYYNRGQVDQAEHYYEQALARIDRMTEREKLRTRGGYYLMKLDYPNAIAAYSSLVEQFPADAAGHVNLALAYFYARDMAKAVDEGLRSVELDPNRVTNRNNLAWYALASGDFEIARQQANAALELNAEYVEAYLARALAELVDGQATVAIETYQALQGVSARGESVATTGLADLALYQGRTGDAIGILEAGVETDLEMGRYSQAADKHLLLAEAYGARGRIDQALAAAERALAASGKVGLKHAVARVFLDAGRPDRALALADELDQRLQPEPRAYARLIRGEVRATAGDVAEGIRLMREAQDLVDTWLGRLALGRAYLEAAAWAEAHSELEISLRRRGEATAVYFDDVPSSRYLPPLHYYIGVALEGLNSPAAAAAFRTFVEIKQGADGDPLVEDARRRLESS